MSKKLFGTDGIRGTANEWPITPELALRLGRAVARVLDAQQAGKHKVVIGKDTRISGYMLETAITSGLVAEGATVLLTGPAPTPAVAHFTRTMRCDAGIMLTASHNPYPDNGIKIFGPDGFKLNDALELEVEKIILAEKVAEKETTIGKAKRIDDAIGRYIEFAKTAAGDTSLKGLKVVIDCAHGAGYYAAPLIFNELGAEVVAMSTHPNGTNINADCGAMHPEACAQAVIEHGADIGICLDGDADRVIFCDHTGAIVNGDQVLCLCAKAMKAAGQLKGDTLVATVMSNLGMRDSLAADGIKLETTPVGDRHVLECMRDKGFNLGGENSGHIIFSDFGTTGDGIVSALKVLTFMSKAGKSLAELANCMEIYPQVLLNMMVTEKPAVDDIPGMTEAIASAEKVFGDRGRVLVRYSGTEKKIRILTECADGQLASAEANKMAEIINQTIGA